MKTVVSQNYFTFLNKVYQLTKGDALRSPILSIVAEIFWQFYEDTYMKHLLRTSNVMFYKAYVDCKDWCRTHHLQWNHIHRSIIFIPTYENDRQMQFFRLLFMWRVSTIKDDI